MKKSILTFAVAVFITLSPAFAQVEGKLVNKTGYINFFSHTAVEDISADNYKVVSTLDVASGEVVYSVPMQSFEFEKAKMQQHYNSAKFLDTKTFPKAKFKGKIINLSDIDFSKDGTYNANVSGELAIHGVAKPVTETGTITINGSKALIETKMKITLADFEIAFEKGKPSTNIAKTIDVTVKAEYN